MKPFDTSVADYWWCDDCRRFVPSDSVGSDWRHEYPGNVTLAGNVEYHQCHRPVREPRVLYGRNLPNFATRMRLAQQACAEFISDSHVGASGSKS